MGAVATRLAVWLALLALLALTVTVAYAPLGGLRLPASLLIAAVKAGLVGWWFMDLRRRDGIVRIAAGLAVFFVILLIVLGWFSMHAPR